MAVIQRWPAYGALGIVLVDAWTLGLAILAGIIIEGDQVVVSTGSTVYTCIPKDNLFTPADLNALKESHHKIQSMSHEPALATSTFSFQLK